MTTGGNGPEGITRQSPGESDHKMSEKIETTNEVLIFKGLHGWSGQGCTATYREASKFLKPYSDKELIEAHSLAAGHYEHWHQYAEAELDTDLDEDGDVASDENGDTMMAVEEMHDALKVRSLIGFELTVRRDAANKAAKATKPSTKE